MGKLIVTDNMKRFVTNNTRIFDEALGRMARDVKQLATIRVPFKEGDLQKSIRAERRGVLNHRVIVDKPYAAFQEHGQRADGSHKVRRYSTPGTGKKYLSGAGLTVKKDAVNYIKQAASKVRAR